MTPDEGINMASSGKQKTTFSKLQREASVRERRAEKAARKEARKYAAANPSPSVELDPGLDGSDAAPESGELEPATLEQSS
jgi:hypothetical protein